MAFHLLAGYGTSPTAAQSATDKIGTTTHSYALFNEMTVLVSCRLLTRCETAKYLFRNLSFELTVSHEDGMTAPRIAVKLVHALDNSCPQGIQVYVANQFEKV